MSELLRRSLAGRSNRREPHGDDLPHRRALRRSLGRTDRTGTPRDQFDRFRNRLLECRQSLLALHGSRRHPASERNASASGPPVTVVRKPAGHRHRRRRPRLRRLRTRPHLQLTIWFSSPGTLTFAWRSAESAFNASSTSAVSVLRNLRRSLPPTPGAALPHRLDQKSHVQHPWCHVTVTFTVAGEHAVLLTQALCR